ncbi:hypothetical protein KP509_38G057800 [Ceratopteris richardii]|uniref:Uncharacterized protein n=1 Tax=Ceratopteris richardii TaxID=49495 RepID=A0A8T2Q689_CERRI|nr:hypothetical protein KP509_38G057800 [Ceratopteris richardii]
MRKDIAARRFLSRTITAPLVDLYVQAFMDMYIDSSIRLTRAPFKRKLDDLLEGLQCKRCRIALASETTGNGPAPVTRSYLFPAVQTTNDSREWARVFWISLSNVAFYRVLHIPVPYHQDSSYQSDQFFHHNIAF